MDCTKEHIYGSDGYCVFCREPRPAWPRPTVEELRAYCLRNSRTNMIANNELFALDAALNFACEMLDKCQLQRDANLLNLNDAKAELSRLREGLREIVRTVQYAADEDQHTIIARRLLGDSTQEEKP